MEQAIENIDIIRNRVINWQVSDIAYLKMLSLIPDKNGNRLILNITFLSQDRLSSLNWPNNSEVFNEVLLSFYDVSNLNVKFEGRSIPQLMGFDITDISSNGWEDINFQIEDYENNNISFYCKKIEAISIKQSIML